MALVAACAFAPWLLKNVYFYGNPVYPFLNAAVGWAAPAHWDNFLADARSRSLPAFSDPLSALKEVVAEPWMISVLGRDIDDWLSPAFLHLVPLALCLRWRLFDEDSNAPRASRIAVVFALAGYVAWFLSSELVRFILPVLPMISCALTISLMHGAYPRWVRLTASSAVLCLLMFNFRTTFGALMEVARWDYLTGRLTRREFLSNSHTGYGLPYYSAMEFINQNLPASSRVLFLGESRAYFCERDFIAASVFDHNPFWRAAGEAASLEDLRSRVGELGVTHVFLSPAQLYYRADFQAVVPIDIISKDTFRQFFANYFNKVFEDRQLGPDGRLQNWIIVYELLNTPRRDPNQPSTSPFEYVLSILRREGRLNLGGIRTKT
jgi:hypothetical protein